MTLSWEEGATIVNLEEIHETGCVVESETALPEGADVELRCGRVCLEGKIEKTEEHDFGFRTVVSFCHGSTWSLALFRPEHLLDLSAMKQTASKPLT